MPFHVSSLLFIRWDFFSTHPKNPFRPQIKKIINSLRVGTGICHCV